MIDIGINYIAGNDECYRILKKYNIINTVKFPGRICDYEHMESCIKLAEELDLKIDLHGLPGMVPAFSCMSDNFIKNVDWIKLSKTLENVDSISRISTHMGLEHGDSFDNYTDQDIKKKWQENYNNLQEGLKKALHRRIGIGLENIPGGFKYDEQSLKPEYVSENWKLADFGVFDICHAKLAAHTLKMDFKEYFKSLSNKDKVKIFHVSGNNDKSNKYETKPDKHVLLSGEEIEDIINSLNKFKNLDLIVSEYSFESKYSIKKEILIEAIVLESIAKYRNAFRSKQLLSYLENEIEDDTKNIEEIINWIQSKN